MLADKDIAGVISAVKPHIDHWYAAGIVGPRGTSAEATTQKLATAQIAAVTCCASVSAALAAARDAAKVDDKILVFGSFYTVSEAMQALNIKV
jgi:dihydrofolate synthase/folylpolyglutamate synthase